MAGVKLSAKAQEIVEYLETVLKECDHFASLVEQFATAKTNPDLLSGQLARELQQLRQHAMIKNLGFVADTAGQLGVQAGRGGSQAMKSRVLRDGIVSLTALAERTQKAAIQADESERKEKEYQAAKAKKAQADAVKARVLAEEAKEAAKKAAAAQVSAAPAPKAPPAAPGGPAPAKP